MTQKRNESFRPILCRGSEGVSGLLEMEQMAERKRWRADPENDGIALTSIRKSFPGL